MSDTPSPEEIQRLRKRAAAEPLDLDLRFELGVALFKSGDVRSAIPELQRARKHPDHSAEATRLLAKVFKVLGMIDVALRLGHLPDDESPDPDAGSAPKPAPLHPITPLVDSAAKRPPDGADEGA